MDQLQNQVIDLEDVQGNISITDLTFNDFKIDLEKSSDDELEELKHIPPSSFAVVKSNLETIKPGALFCLKDANEDYVNKLKNNILYPYFLVYVSEDGEELVKATQTKLALDYFRKLCMGNDSGLQGLIAEFDQETAGTRKMSKYTAILEKVVQDVVGVQEEVGLDSLATPGGTSMFREKLKQEENLELIAALYIK